MLTAFDGYLREKKSCFEACSHVCGVKDTKKSEETGNVLNE